MSPRPRSLRWSNRVDLVLALVLCGVAQLGVVLSGGPGVSLISMAVCTLPLAARRRAPLLAAFAVAVTPLIDRALGGPGSVSLEAGVVAAYSVAAYAPWWRAVVGGVLMLSGVWLMFWWTAPPDSNFSVAAVVLAVPWVAGRVGREHRRQSQQLRILAARLDREREASARLAVVEERARMARELHDAIAHAVSQMVVQAAAAETVVTSAPERAREALQAIQQTGRDAITELRRMLRILRTEDDTTSPGIDAPETALPAPRPRLTLAPSPRLDALVALVCLAVAELEVLTEPRYGTPSLASALLILAATAPLVLRRRFPLAVLLAIIGALASQQLLVDWEGETPWTLMASPLVALYTLGAYATPRRALLGAALTIVVAVAAGAAIEGRLVGWDVAYWLIVVGASVLSGRAVRSHRQQADQLRVLTARLERERDARARLAAIDERARVARELHDAIAHGVSVMVLQAGAAEQVMTAAVEQAARAMGAVQDTGRTVLDELRQLLGVLRTDEDESPRTPIPGLGQLETLIAHVRHAGLPVELRIHGEPIPLPDGVDGCAYRLIQEGLTNVLKHAGPLPTGVSLRYQPDAFELEVHNADSDPRRRAPDEPGHGLIGMRERVELYGGDFQAGPRPSGGYTLHARLPLGSRIT